MGKELEIAIKIAGKVEKSFNSSLKAVSNGIKGTLKVATATTTAAALALGAMSGAAIKTGSNFETAMSQVQATMLIDKTAAEGKKNFEILENSARECGATTAFSATEAAEGLNYLALAGYDAKKAAGALPTVLRIAGAGAMELADASDMVTDAMSALNIDATSGNLTRFGDELAKTASKSNTSVAQLGEAILTVGGTANGLKEGTVELNTALGVLANNGIKGAEGGTKLRNIILSLSAPTTKAQKVMKSLGLQAYDSQGNLRNLQDIFIDMKDKMSGMTTKEQNSYITQMFNKTDLKGVRAMLKDCGSSWEELAGNIDNCAGACQQMYDIQLDNLQGDIKILQSGLEDLGISFYKDVNSPIRETVQLATDMVGRLSSAYSSGGFNGMIQEVGTCFSVIVTEAAENAPKVVNIAISTIESLVSGIEQNTGKIGSAVANAGTNLITGYVKIIPKLVIVGIDMTMAIAEGIIKQGNSVANNGNGVINKFFAELTKRIPMMLSLAQQLTMMLANGIIQNIPQIAQAAITIIMQLILTIAQASPSIVNLGLNLVVALVQGIVGSLPQVIVIAGQVVQTLIRGVVSLIPQIFNVAGQILISLINGITQNLPGLVQTAFNIIATLIEGLITAWPQLMTCVIRLGAYVWKAIININWLQLGKEILLAIGNGIINCAKSFGKGVKNAIKGLVKGDASIKTPFSTDKSAASEAGAQQANAFATSVNAGISTANINTDVFGGANIGAASTAGAQQANAFATSVNAGISTANINTDVFGGANIGAASTAGAQQANAFTASINSGINTSKAVSETQNLTGQVRQAESEATQIFARIVSAAQNAARGIKEAFESMTIRIPRPQIPEVNVSYSNVKMDKGGNMSVPHFNVSWHKEGGIFSKPTLFNTAGGVHGVGEAGKEAILPLDELWNKMEDILQGNREDKVTSLLRKVQGIGSRLGGDSTNNKRQYAMEGGNGGVTIQYSPVYNIESGSKEDIIEAGKMSQTEFERYMKRYEKDKKRKKL